MMPVIGNGSHRGGAGGCVMEWVSLLREGHAVIAVDGLPTLKEDRTWITPGVNDKKSDLPPCTNRVIALAAQRANDATPEAERDEFGRRFLDRILRARALDPATEKRVDVRLAVWAAREVEHLVPEALSGMVAGCLATVERWLAGDATGEECLSAAAKLHSAAAAYETDAAYAAAYAAAAAATTYAAADTAAAATYAAARQDWLDRLLDAHQKAVAEEGAYADLIELWEADACAYAEEVSDG